MVVTGFDDRGVIVNSGQTKQGVVETDAFVRRWNGRILDSLDSSGKR